MVDVDSSTTALAEIGLVPELEGAAAGATSRRRRRHNWALDAGVLLAVAILAVAAFHTTVEPQSPSAQNLLGRLKGPSWSHLLGTDEVGRDELSRIIAGLPYTLGVTAIAVGIATTIGTTLGVVGAAWPRWPRFVVRRLVDFGIVFPFLVAAVVVLVIVGHGFVALSITLGAVTWPIFARVTLAEGLVAASQEYVLAARLMGVGPARRARRHLLPAMRRTVLVMMAFMFADLVLLQSALAFIGLSAAIGTPTWGNMLASSEQYLTRAPWLLAAPSGAIVLSVIVANLLGDGLARRAPGSRTARRTPRLLGRHGPAPQTTSGRG